MCNWVISTFCETNSVLNNLKNFHFIIPVNFMLFEIFMRFFYQNFTKVTSNKRLLK